jgi:hypothetical protein
MRPGSTVRAKTIGRFGVAFISPPQHGYLLRQRKIQIAYVCAIHGAIWIFFTSSHLIILSGLRSIEFFNNQL